MAQETFNDVDVVWTGSGGAVTIHQARVTVDDGAADVDTSSAEEARHTYKDGIADPSTIVEAKGSSIGVILGDKGTLAITGMPDNITNGCVFEKSVEGTEDQPITSSFTICPSSAA